MNDLDRLDRRIREIETTSKWAYKQVKFMLESAEDKDGFLNSFLDPRNYENVDKRIQSLEERIIQLEQESR